MIEFAVAAIVGLGLAIIVVALLQRGRRRQDEILEYLSLPFGEEDVDIEEIVERAGLLRPSSAAVDQVLTRLNLVDRIGVRLQKARLPLRPGEFVMLIFAIAVAAGIWGGLIVSQLFIGIVIFFVTPLLGFAWLSRRVSKRQRAFEEQLPATLGLIAASLRSGHTLQRAISMMVEEAPPPINEELEQVIAETRLGVPLIDALDRMAERVEMQDFEWIVHAIRIQQQTGGKLADLLFTLADYMRQREEVRREIKVLTAEGRLSAVVLASLPILMAFYIQIRNPSYLAELTTGLGLALAVGGIILMALGLFVILQLIKSVEP